MDAYDQWNAGIARYANDEWQMPNVRVVKESVDGRVHFFLKCMRPIAVGDEIRYDYNYEDAYWRPDKVISTHM